MVWGGRPRAKPTTLLVCFGSVPRLTPLQFPSGVWFCTLNAQQPTCVYNLRAPKTCARTSKPCLFVATCSVRGARAGCGFRVSGSPPKWAPWSGPSSHSRVWRKVTTPDHMEMGSHEVDFQRFHAPANQHARCLDCLSGAWILCGARPALR